MSNILNLIYINFMAFYGKLTYKKYVKMSRNASKIAEEQLLKRIRKNENTEFGRRHSFKSIKSYEDYKRIMPLTDYNEYKEFTDDLLENGTQGRLIKDKIDFLVHTSGTTGVKKMFPVTKEIRIPYLKSAAILFWNIKLETKKRLKVFRGRGLTTVDTDFEVAKSGIKYGYISGYAMSSVKKITPLTTCVPKEVFGCNEDLDMEYIKARYSMADKNLIYLMCVFMSSLTDLMHYIMENHEMIINDIEKGTIDASIKLPEKIRHDLLLGLKPDPKRAEELRMIFSSNSHYGIVPRIWPRMSIVLGISSAEFVPHKKKMMEYTGKSIAYSYVMYSASESMISTALFADCKDYMLMPDAGFFEFIPVDDESKVLPMNELEVGKKYEVVITNQCGLYRYKIEDVVTITGYINEIPMLQFAYRKKQIVNIGGLHLTIEHLEAAIEKLEVVLNNKIIDYSIGTDYEHVPTRMMLFLELEKQQEIDNLAQIFDDIVTEINDEHGRMIGTGQTASSIVYIVKNRTYENYRKERMKEVKVTNQIKAVRYIDTEDKYNYFIDNVFYRSEVNG